MVRLIDADRLHDEIYEQTKFKQDPVTGDWVAARFMRISEILRRINDQPTISVTNAEEEFEIQAARKGEE